MPLILEDRLQERETWPTHDRCSIERAIALVRPNRANLLLLREAAYGTTRFQDFVERTGLSVAAVSAALKHLVNIDMLAKRPYQTENSRPRDEYILTEQGEDFLVVLLALLEWGDRYAQPGAAPVRLVADDTERRIRIRAVDSTGRAVPVDNIRVTGQWAT